MAEAKPVTGSKQPAVSSKKKEAAKPSAEVQREPIAEAKPVISSQQSAVSGQKPPSELQTVEVQREINLPEAKPAEKPAPAVQEKAVQREPMPAAETKTIQREIHLPEAKPVEKPAAQVKAQTVQREMKLPAAKPMSGERPAGGRISGTPEVQREMSHGQDHEGESLNDLLKGLPTHYEMPKEQIEAIRSGKPYVKPQSVSAAPETAVQRELPDGPSKPAGHRAQAASRNGRQQAAEAVIRNIVQREPELVLPKQKKEKVSDSTKSEPVVQRESSSKPAAAEKKKSSVKMPAVPVLPMGSSAPNGAMGSAPRIAASPAGSFGGDTGLIQREPLDAEEPPVVQREPMGTGNNQASSADESDNESGKMPQIVSSRQLDSLADKLVPRIKRMMRAEMERGVFR